MRPNLKETADLVTFTEEIVNGKLHFLCSDVDHKARVRQDEINVEYPLH